MYGILLLGTIIWAAEIPNFALRAVISSYARPSLVKICLLTIEDCENLAIDTEGEVKKTAVIIEMKPFLIEKAIFSPFIFFIYEYYEPILISKVKNWQLAEVK